jgi:hypothetical protein
MQEGGEKESRKEDFNATITSHKSIGLQKKKNPLRFVNDREERDYFLMKENIERNTGPKKH